APVIGALDQYFRPHPPDQFQRRVLLEDDDQIDRLQGSQYFGASVFVLNRPALALDSRPRCIAVPDDPERGASFGCRRQHFDMTRMQQIKTTIGEADT